MKSNWLPILAAAALIPQIANADVTYQETTKITGGSLKSMLKLADAFSSQARQANSDTVTTVRLHGNRMVRSNPHTTEIIDLDQQSITFIDHDKHSYSVMTFQQMKDAMTNAMAKAKEQSASKGSQPPASGDGQMNFDAHITSNGTTRTIEGLQAKEALVTVTMLANAKANDGTNVNAGMAATSEMWLVPEIPGMDELRAFNQRMMQELSVDATANQMSGMLAAQPGGAEALADLKKEASKMQGFPVLQVTRVGVSADGQPLAAPSVAPLPAGQGNKSSAGDVTREVATDTGTQAAGSEVGKLGTLGRALGSSGLGAFMRHKPQPKAESAGPSVNPATAGVLLESQTSIDHFSTSPADLSSFDVPSGYKQVASPMVKNAQ
ncbi:MAG TPA: hypothetical protein VGI45_10605 [Terracidiphilus sp.]|jgi:hypothetical protein